MTLPSQDTWQSAGAMLGLGMIAGAIGRYSAEGDFTWRRAVRDAALLASNWLIAILIVHRAGLDRDFAAVVGVAVGASRDLTLRLAMFGWEKWLRKKVEEPGAVQIMTDCATPTVVPTPANPAHAAPITVISITGTEAEASLPLKTAFPVVPSRADFDRTLVQRMAHIPETPPKDAT